MLAGETVDLSDSDEGKGGSGNERNPLDPRIFLELEDERNHIESRIQYISEKIANLLLEQDSLEARKKEIDDKLLTVTVSVSKGDKITLSNPELKWSLKFSWDDELENVMNTSFGIDSFRKHQKEVINAVLCKRDVFVIMPAGGGKSLCYQIPAMMSNGITLVISPLLSLIEDQMMILEALGIPSQALTSSITKEAEKAVYTFLEKGTPELHFRLLFVTPEKIARSKRFLSKLEKCNHGGRLSLIAIDEAHCCSQWGHDFRTDYLSLGVLKKQFPKVPMMALTATATARVQTDVKEMLRMRKCETFVSSVNRPNLFYEVRDKPSHAATLLEDICQLITSEFSKNDSGIIYCFSRKECEQLAKDLTSKGITATHYHAEMDAPDRSRAHRMWSQGQIQVIVGTIAFGMGINKPDVRFVIHHTISKSIETYYQESGRAGRDGFPSRCVLYFRCLDVTKQSSMVFSETAGLLNLYSMADYCLTRVNCRRKAIVSHFGEAPQDCHGMCDNCSEAKQVIEVDVSDTAKLILEIVSEKEELDQKVTLLQLTDLVVKFKGKKTAVPREDIERIIVKLLLEYILKEVFFHTAYSTNAYLVTGRMADRLLNGRLKVALEVEASKQSRKKVVKQLTPIEEMLELFRKDIAMRNGGIFPYSVLSSDQIRLLGLSVPCTIGEIEAIIGKKKCEQFGEQLLLAMKDFNRGEGRNAYEERHEAGGDQDEGEVGGSVDPANSNKSQGRKHKRRKVETNKARTD